MPDDEGPIRTVHLPRRLRREGVVPEAYELDGSGRDEVYCLEEDAGRWRVYYRERGLRRHEHEFETEAEACRFFLSEVLRDPTTRRPRRPLSARAKGRVLQPGLADTSQAPRGRNIAYRCTLCGTEVPSVPAESRGCRCGNIFIDVDYNNLSVDRLDAFEAVRVD